MQLHTRGMATLALLCNARTHCCTPGLLHLQELELVRMLVEAGQAHVFGGWPAPGACGRGSSLVTGVGGPRPVSMRLIKLPQTA